MNRHLSIIVILLIILVVAIGGAFIFFTRDQAPSATTEIPPSGTLPSVPQPNDASQSKDAVQAAFESAMAPYGSEHIQFLNTVIAGDYALQLWKGDTMGGEGLLQYEASQNNWNVITDGGGAWTLEDLVGAGVPQSSATVLLAGMPQ